jgi:hypothetical protein
VGLKVGGYVPGGRWGYSEFEIRGMVDFIAWDTSEALGLNRSDWSV